MTVRIRTVLMNERGQIVIPEEIRRDWGLGKRETLVLIEKDNELSVMKESDAAKAFVGGEDQFWKAVSMESLKGFWGKEDKAWDKIAKEMLR